MKKETALEFSFTIDKMCEEQKITVEPRDGLLDVTLKMVKRQDDETLNELYERFYNRTSHIALNLICAIETERRLRTSQ